MHVLALDLGTSLGWAMRSAGGPIRHGTVNLSAPAHQGIGWRYAKFKRFLVAAKNNMGGLDHLVYENVSFMGPNGFRAVQLWGGFEAIATCWCEYHGIAYHPVATGTLKKSVTGNGHAQKPDMVAAIEAAGYHVRTHDEADAIGLMLHFDRLILPDYIAA